jgi:hypothetical protein
MRCDAASITGVIAHGSCVLADVFSTALVCRMRDMARTGKSRGSRRVPVLGRGATASLLAGRCRVRPPSSTMCLPLCVFRHVAAFNAIVDAGILTGKRGLARRPCGQASRATRF